MITINDVNLSVQLRIYQILRQLGWFTRVEEEMAAGEGLTYFLPDAHGFVHIDENCEPFSDVSVKVGSTIVSPSSYTIDFENASITFNASPGAGAVKCSASCWEVRVTEGFPANEDLEHLKLPSIAYEVNGERGRPFGIGSAAEFIRYELGLDVLATNGRQLKELGSQLRKMIAYLPLLKFEETPLGYGGALNTDFDPEEQFVNFAACVRMPHMTIVPPRRAQSPKLEHRAVIDAQMEIVG